LIHFYKRKLRKLARGLAGTATSSRHPRNSAILTSIKLGGRSSEKFQF